MFVLASETLLELYYQSLCNELSVLRELCIDNCHKGRVDV